MIIYAIQNRINGKVYIGQTTCSLEKRIKNHMFSSSCCIVIYNALKKYGIDAFNISTIDTAKNIDELNKLEEKYIKEYNSLSPNGYNLTTGGNNCKCSEETKRKIGEANKGKHLSEETKKKISEAKKGSHPTEETKKKISEASKGKILSEETRRKISKAEKGKKHHFYGKHFSEETRKKLSGAHKGNRHTEETKRKISETSKGKIFSEETKKKLSEANRGERSPTAKLTEKQVIEIKKMLKSGNYIQLEIAKKFNVAGSTIGSISGGYNWKYLNADFKGV